MKNFLRRSSKLSLGPITSSQINRDAPIGHIDFGAFAWSLFSRSLAGLSTRRLEHDSGSELRDRVESADLGQGVSQLVACADVLQEHLALFNQAADVVMPNVDVLGQFRRRTLARRHDRGFVVVVQDDLRLG